MITCSSCHLQPMESASSSHFFTLCICYSSSRQHPRIRSPQTNLIGSAESTLHLLSFGFRHPKPPLRLTPKSVRGVAFSVRSLLPSSPHTITGATGPSSSLQAHSASVATTIGTMVAYFLVPMRSRGQDRWKIAAALMGRHIGGAVNYVAIADALGVSSSVLAAGLAAHNIICAVYFTNFICFRVKSASRIFNIRK